MFLKKTSGLELDKAWAEFQRALGVHIDAVVKAMANDPLYLSKLAEYAKEKSGAYAKTSTSEKRQVDIATELPLAVARRRAQHVEEYW
ncbi:MAG: hypothetical protein WA058_02350 [Minisyncoccia bacterium]